MAVNVQQEQRVSSRNQAEPAASNAANTINSIFINNNKTKENEAAMSTNKQTARDVPADKSFLKFQQRQFTPLRTVQRQQALATFANEQQQQLLQGEQQRQRNNMSTTVNSSTAGQLVAHKLTHRSQNKTTSQNEHQIAKVTL